MSFLSYYLQLKYLKLGVPEGEIKEHGREEILNAITEKYSSTNKQKPQIERQKGIKNESHR